VTPLIRGALAAALLVAAAGCAGHDAAGILGAPPSYGPSGVDSPPNQAAIIQRIWVPGLDDYYDPQGLALAGGDVLVSAFQSRDRNVNKGQCRIWRVDAASGQIRAALTLPFQQPYDPTRDCGHGGGLAVFADGTMVLADTELLFVTTLEATDKVGPTIRLLHLGPGLTGGVAAAGPDNTLWLGTHIESGPGQIYRFDLKTVTRLADGAILEAKDAAAPVAIPSYAQGAAFDRAGKLWIARSDIGWGELVRLDPATGAEEARYDVPAATEGIAFDGAGRLWAVSEAGTRRFYDFWPVPLLYPFYPLVYAVDVGALRK
jgi:hypothetical protein